MLWPMPDSMYPDVLILRPALTKVGSAGDLGRSYGEGVTIRANVARPKIVPAEVADQDVPVLRFDFTTPENPDIGTEMRDGQPVPFKMRKGTGVEFMGLNYPAAGPMVVEGSEGEVVTSWAGSFDGVP